MVTSKPDLKGLERRFVARGRRAASATTDHASGLPVDTPVNTDEADFAQEGFPASFTKGLPHAANGTVAAGYAAFTEAINRVNDAPDQVVSFANVPTGAGGFSSVLAAAGGATPQITWRGWESPRTGHYFDLQGPDADAFGMAPAPALGTAELTAEMAEVYAMALLRDVPFHKIETEAEGASDPHTGISVQEVLAGLNAIPFFGEQAPADTYARRRRAARLLDPDQYDLDTGEAQAPLGPVTGANLFRGSGPGAKKGPWVSQLMQLGNAVAGFSSEDGKIAYGSQLIDQRTGFFEPGLDFMTNWGEWLDVQNGADFRGLKGTVGMRFVTTPRDIATYVRFDALYQAYLNACLVLLGQLGDRNPDLTLQQGFPDTLARDESDNEMPRTGFASFGGPHVLSLVTEVVTRCLKFARRQKFNWHRRARPEKISGLLTLAALAGHKDVPALGPHTQEKAAAMVGALEGLADLVHSHNQAREAANRGQRGVQGTQLYALGAEADAGNLLLAMAFPEGSPMHPAYAAGHATVAGGCVTMLKAFFRTLDDQHAPLPWSVTGLPIVEAQLVGGSNESALCHVEGARAQGMTLEGELNKLAANISIARNMAGVHYYSDYYDSLRMGERVAVGILLEQMQSYDEPVSMTFRSFDGDKITISTAHPDAAEINGDITAYKAWTLRPQTDPVKNAALLATLSGTPRVVSA
ncbi:MAG: bromoperoxidase [Pseudomonadota bacterium]